MSLFLQHIKAINAIIANTPNAIINTAIAPTPNVVTNPVRAATSAPTKNVKANITTASIRHKHEQSFFLFSFLQI